MPGKPKTNVSVRYEGTPEIRAGQPVFVITRTAESVPVSGRGREWSASSTAKSVTVIPFEEVEDLLTACVRGLTFFVPFGRGEEPPQDRGPEPAYKLVDSERGVEQFFWSWSEAEALVAERTAEGRITKGWLLYHPDGELIKVF